MYTVTEFKNRLRKALNDAEQGHEVVIERYGVKYQLVCLVDKPLPGHQMESHPDKKATLKSDEVIIAEAAKPWNQARPLPSPKPIGYETPSQKADREVREERIKRMNNPLKLG